MIDYDLRTNTLSIETPEPVLETNVQRYDTTWCCPECETFSWTARDARPTCPSCGTTMVVPDEVVLR